MNLLRSERPNDAVPPGAFRLVKSLVRGVQELCRVLAPAVFTASELQSVYQAALGHDVSATNLKRILVRREQITATGVRSAPGRSGGRPAAEYRFRTRQIEVTDQFAVLRPPEPPRTLSG